LLDLLMPEMDGFELLPVELPKLLGQVEAILEGKGK
jgi:hypothetical protein